MDITPLVPQGRKTITGYGGGGFKINYEFVEGSLLVFVDQVEAWDVQEASAITIDKLASVLARQDVELLLIGTGARTVVLDPSIRLALKAKGIGVDIMDTGAACRTYNALLAEERRVAAAVIAI